MRSGEDEGVTLEVKVQPRASRDRLLGREGDRVKIALAAPPVDGAANDALVSFVAAALGVARRDVEIVRGHRGRLKLLRVRGASRESIETWLASAPGRPGT